MKRIRCETHIPHFPRESFCAKFTCWGKATVVVDGLGYCEDHGAEELSARMFVAKVFAETS